MRRVTCSRTLLVWTVMDGSYKVIKKGVTKQELSSDQEKNRTLSVNGPSKPCQRI